MYSSISKIFQGLIGRGAKGVAYNHASIPAGAVIIAIGDIHGNLNALDKLLAKLRSDVIPDAKEILCIFLGDYIDRGQASKRVVERLIDWSDKHTTIFLQGNHEASLLQFLEDPVRGGNWLKHGGIETLIDYGVIPTLGPYSPRETIALRDQLLLKLPKTHQAFFQNLNLFHSVGDYMFVHAGINPKVPIFDNNPLDLLWIREPFLKHRSLFEKVVIHGHTITPNGEPEIRRNRVGIDTGSYFNGIITAMIIQGDQKSFLSSKSI
jgi:serine/threonine protein phosphatase 1